MGVKWTHEMMMDETVGSDVEEESEARVVRLKGEE